MLLCIQKKRLQVGLCVSDGLPGLYSSVNQSVNHLLKYPILINQLINPIRVAQLITLLKPTEMIFPGGNRSNNRII